MTTIIMTNESRKVKVYNKDNFDKLISKLYKMNKENVYFDIEAYTMTASTGCMKIDTTNDIIAFMSEIFKAGLL